MASAPPLPWSKHMDRVCIFLSSAVGWKKRLLLYLAAFPALMFCFPEEGGESAAATIL